MTVGVTPVGLGVVTLTVEIAFAGLAEPSLTVRITTARLTVVILTASVDTSCRELDALCDDDVSRLPEASGRNGNVGLPGRASRVAVFVQ